MIRTANDVSVVIGSWGSYNDCNERALGSKWLNLADYDAWDEIVKELENEGFELNGIDEELFIQDIDNLPSSGTNWDYMNPERLFEILKESEVLDDYKQYEIMEAFLEVRSFDDFMQRVEDKGANWSDDINIYHNYDWEDYGREMFSLNGCRVDENIEYFFDFEAYGKYIGSDYVEEYSDGLIEISY